jgi:pimeloyl-ACP methyl ester carboxylesterase
MAATNETWRSELLGERKRLRLPQGTIGYHDTGSGPTVVFVHGALVNSNLWRKVVAQLAPAGARCVALDLPLGAHIDAMPPDADIAPPAIAELIADAIEALELDDVTLVGNDTGGALCQLVVTRRPERIGRLVLTSCDAFEHFPPPVMRPLMPLLRNATVMGLAFSPMRIAALRHRAMTAIRGTKRPVDKRVMDSWTFPGLNHVTVRRDAAKLARGMDKALTLEAAERLRDFHRPALIAWSREDKFFPPHDAERLVAVIPNARLEWIDDAYTFSPEDQPDRLAELIAAFTSEPAPASSHTESPA